MKKAEYNLQQHVILFVMVCGILVTLGTFAYTSTQEYSSFGTTATDSSFADTYNKVDDISKQTKEISDKLENTDLGTQNSNTNFYGDILSVAKIVFKSIGASGSMMTGMLNSLDIPPIWITIAMIIMIISIAFSVVFMIFKPS